MDEAFLKEHELEMRASLPTNGASSIDAQAEQSKEMLIEGENNLQSQPAASLIDRKRKRREMGSENSQGTVKNRKKMDNLQPLASSKQLTEKPPKKYARLRPMISLISRKRKNTDSEDWLENERKKKKRRISPSGNSSSMVINGNNGTKVRDQRKKIKKKIKRTRP